MGVTRELAPVLIDIEFYIYGAHKTVSSFLLVESNGRDSCATSRDTRDAHSNELFQLGFRGFL